MSILWIIVFVLCWYSQTESQTVHIVEHKTDWFTAYQTCTMQQGRLPSVNIDDNRLKLKDLSDTKNISSPFWIAATNHFMHCNHFEPHYEDLCPGTFCPTIANSSGKLIVEWTPCSECYNFSCARSYSQIYQEADLKSECKDWLGAFQECKAKAYNLATRENAEFLESVKHSAKTFWFDDQPLIHLSPKIGMQNRTCFYSFNGIIHEGNCSDPSITTVCILAKTAHIVEKKTDWFTAYHTCTMQQGRLPHVIIYYHRLQPKDINDTKNITYPFWITTEYDTKDCKHFELHYEDLCPDTFCPRIALSSGKTNIEWRPCSECNNFYCAISLSEIYQEADIKYECKDWPGAFKECKERNVSLATRENVPFLERVKTSAKTFWLDYIPQINLAPDIRMQNRTCFYSFNGIIREGNCSNTSMTTVCILVKTTGMTPTISTVFPSQTVYTAGMTHTEEDSMTNNPVITLSTLMDTSNSYMLDSSKKKTEKISENRAIGLWPILGSALGGFVATIIIVFMIIIVLSRRRLEVTLLIHRRRSIFPCISCRMTLSTKPLIITIVILQTYIVR